MSEKNPIAKSATEWTNMFFANLSTKEQYAAAARAKKNGFEKTHVFLKAYADMLYAKMKMNQENAEEALKAAEAFGANKILADNSIEAAFEEANNMETIKVILKLEF